MIVKYVRPAGAGFIEYRGTSVLTAVGVVLVSDNADEQLIPWHRVIEVDRYRTDNHPTIRTALHNI